MKKFYVVLSVVMILILFSVTVFVRAGDLPPIPLTTAAKETSTEPEESSTIPEASTDFEMPIDPQPTTAYFWLSESSMKMYYKSTAKLTASGRVTWSSSDEDVVQVDGSGNLTAVGVGKADVKAVSSDGRSRTCTVKVRYSVAQWCILILFFGWIWGY